jgi:hypothetical protein
MLSLSYKSRPVRTIKAGVKQKANRGVRRLEIFETTVVTTLNRNGLKSTANIKRF